MTSHWKDFGLERYRKVDVRMGTSMRTKILGVGAALSSAWFVGSCSLNEYKYYRIENKVKNLNQEKYELVEKIDQYKTLIPMMKESYAIQYTDSLELAENNLNELEIQEKYLQEARDQIESETFLKH